MWCHGRFVIMTMLCAALFVPNCVRAAEPHRGTDVASRLIWRHLAGLI